MLKWLVNKFANLVMMDLGRPWTLTIEWDYKSSVEDLIVTWSTIATEIDVHELYDGCESSIRHLVSMVCYPEQHFICFTYNYYLKLWEKYDDAIVEEIGSWDKVLKMCKEEQLRLNALFYGDSMDIEEECKSKNAKGYRFNGYRRRMQEQECKRL